jgi:Domain of Unknown Function with PDB structure (DUF3857)
MAFGKVSKEDLAMTTYEPDTSAAAVVLCDYGECKVIQGAGNFRQKFTQHKRIKILNKAGFGYAGIAIPFYSFKRREEFYFDRAQIKLPDGSKVKLNKKDVFIEELNDKWSVARFTFPKVQEGCVIEYSFVIVSSYIQQLREWYFQEGIPTRWSEFRVEFPSYFAYAYLFQGNENMHHITEIDGMNVYKGPNGTFRISDRRYILQNAPAMTPEPYMTTLDDYIARIQFQLHEVRYPSGQVDKVMSTWSELQKELGNQPFFGEQYQKKSNYKKMVQELLPMTGGLATQTEKARFYYDYFSKNLEWSGRFSMWTRSKQLDDIYEKKNDLSSGELNMMLLAVLREAGITAYPLLTSTRSHGEVRENYPLLEQFNHLMVFALPDLKPVIMDLTEPLSPPGYPNVDALNGRGWLMKPGSPSWMDIKAPSNSGDFFVLNLSLSEKGDVVGTMTGVYRGYNAIPERSFYKNDDKEKHWESRIGRQYPSLKLDSVKCTHLDEIDEPFVDSLWLHIEGAAQSSGDFLYMPSVLYSGFLESPFKLKERLFPVDMSYPYTEHYLMKLQLPPGYIVEELPESVRFKLPGNGGHLHFAVEEKGQGEIDVLAKLLVKKTRFDVQEYQDVKELFDRVAEKYGEMIVLKKGG